MLRRWDLDGRRQLGWHHLEELATALGVQRRRDRTSPPPATTCPSGTWPPASWRRPGRSRAGSRPSPSRPTAIGSPPATTTASSASGTGASQTRLLRKFAPTRSAVSALAFSAGRRPPGLAPARTRPSTVWDAKTAPTAGSLIGHTDRIPGPGLASRRPPALLGRLGHHRPRLGRGQVRADHPAQQPRRPGPRAGPERRRRPAGLQPTRPTPSTSGTRTATAKLQRHCGRRPARSAPWPSPRRPAAGVRRDRAHRPRLGLGKGARQEGAADDRGPRAPASRSARTAGGWWSLGAGATLGVWRTEDATPGPALEGAGVLRAFAASPDGQWIAGSRAGDDDARAGRSDPRPVGRRQPAAASRRWKGRPAPSPPWPFPPTPPCWRRAASAAATSGSGAFPTAGRS